MEALVVFSIFYHLLLPPINLFQYHCQLSPLYLKTPKQVHLFNVINILTSFTTLLPYYKNQKYTFFSFNVKFYYSSRLAYQDIACALIQRTRPNHLQQELINARTNQGKSALHEACTTLMASENRSTVHFIRTINLDVVLALLESGADCATVDNEGDRYVLKKCSI